MKDADPEPFDSLSEALEVAARQNSQPLAEADSKRYEAYLSDTDLTSDQASEIVRVLWPFIVAFVDLGFGVHPAQQACGKPRTELEHASISESTEVQLDQRKQPDEEAPAP